MTTFYIAPASAPADVYAAGYDCNVLHSVEEALDAIRELKALGGEWDIPWVVVSYDDGKPVAGDVDSTLPVGIVASAVNGQRGIGSGYDCDVLRTLGGTLIACVTEVSTKREWMAEGWEDSDPQALADNLASCPCLSNPDWICLSEPYCVGDYVDGLCRQWNDAIAAAKAAQ